MLNFAGVDMDQTCVAPELDELYLLRLRLARCHLCVSRLIFVDRQARFQIDGEPVSQEVYLSSLEAAAVDREREPGNRVPI